jgi:hypothetical protein
MPAEPPFPDFSAAIGLRELAAARKLLKRGLELPRQAVQRIVDRAIEAVVRESFEHDDSCTFWLGGRCDCHLSTEERLWRPGT